MRPITDSTAIYRASMHILSVTEWGEWAYIGVGKDFRRQQAQQIIDSFFPDDTIYVVLGRRNSYQTDKSKVVELIGAHFPSDSGESEVAVWDLNFLRGIRFSRVGVFITGRRKTEA